MAIRGEIMARMYIRRLDCRSRYLASDRHGYNLGFENNTNPVEVVDAASPLAAGVTGTFNAYVSPAYITWETNLSAKSGHCGDPSEPTYSSCGVCL
jgi:hypothetical protein